jgi:asparagine synthase (glutamine-hydrolysing)
MCGIVSWLTPPGAPPADPELLARMNACHRLRGPNHQACLVVDRGVLSGRLGLGHTRLSILDLDARSNQPMFDAQGDHAIVFNGEIYNFRELAADLEALGCRLRTTSDTEVLLLALRRFGEAALERVEGMFAFVYADLRRGTLLAARDRLGVKPLYWARGPHGVAFASTLTPLSLLPGFVPRIDPVARFEMLAAKCVYGARSIYEGVEKVLPGQVVRVEADGACSAQMYWRPRFAQALPDSPATEQALEQCIAGAVRRQMVADVPVGVFLSGGVDSSLVAAMARREAGGLDSFSIGFEDPRYDESPHAEAVARHLGTRHHCLRVGPKEFQEALQDIWQAYDEPFGDASAVPTFLVSRLARRTVTVTLSGDGGDELFFGYTRYHQLARWRRAARCVPGPLRRVAAALAARRPDTFVGRAVLGLLGFRDDKDAYFHFFHNAYPHVAAWLCGLRVRDLDAGDMYRLARQAGENAPNLMQGMQLADLTGYMPSDCLTKVDRASMACSLEARVPLLDEGVVRMALSLPPQANWGQGQGKRMLRRILWRHVPRELVERPKQGFGVPLESWLMGDMRAWTLDLLCPEHLRSADLDVQGVERLLRRFEDGRAATLQYVLWPLCAYMCWFLGQTRRPPG